jgi:hypothetical protein
MRNGFGLDHRRVGDRTSANRDSQCVEADLASRRLESKSKFADERQDQFAGRHSVVQA